jgi:HEAT repeat protein
MPKVLYALLIAAWVWTPAVAQTSSTSTTPNDQPVPVLPAESRSKPVKDQAWGLLDSGLKDGGAIKRATAVHALSLLTGETRAVDLAIHALDDPKPQVRVAAASALEDLHSRSAIPKLRATLSDREPVVVLAAAHSLLTMKDAAAYRVYYEILTGERKGSKGLVAGELDTLRDPKKMAMLGFQEGIGFVPFGDIGYTAIRTVAKDDSSPVRATAAKILAEDADPDSDPALIHAALGDRNQLVRTAALEALARRGNPAVISRIAPALFDDKDIVQYTAAAAIVHLSDVAERRKHAKK